jgi:predicted membrane channel-forming protein YqfA (hemolysin III family)
MVLFIAGLFYTIFILWIGIPFFDAFIPSGDAKTFMLMIIYALPLFVLVGCSVWFIRVSLKKSMESGL